MFSAYLNLLNVNIMQKVALGGNLEKGARGSITDFRNAGTLFGSAHCFRVSK